MKLWGNENMLNLGGIGTIYTWISCVSIQLPCRGMAIFVPDSLQGYLYGEQSWKIERVSPPEAKGKHAVCPLLKTQTHEDRGLSQHSPWCDRYHLALHVAQQELGLREALADTLADALTGVTCPVSRTQESPVSCQHPGTQVTC